MSSLQDLSDYIEAQRERLHQGITYVATLNHWGCDHNIDTIIERDFDEALRQIDKTTAMLGVPWQVGVTHMVREIETQVAEIIREIEGDE